MPFPPAPGPGHTPLTLATPSFYVLATLLGLFAAMLVYLILRYPNRKRAYAGYFEAAGIDLAFLTLSVLLVVGLAWNDARGNRTSWALYQVVLSGYWLTFAIPMVTVASSIESRSRGRIPWVLPSLLLAAAMFGGMFLYYFYA